MNADRIRTPDTASAAAERVRSVFRKLKRRVHEEMGGDELTWSQASALKCLEQAAPTTIAALAREDGVRPQTMGATVASLEAAGLVAGSPDPHDGRQTLWSLTEGGRSWLKTARPARQDWLQRAIGERLDPAEQERLLEALAFLDRVADPAVSMGVGQRSEAQDDR